MNARSTHLSILFSQMFCALLFFTHTVASIRIDNEIVGPINITCMDSGVAVNFKTKNTFDGRVYLRGPMSDGDCATEVAQMDESGGVVLPFTDCKTQRTVDSAGQITDVNLVVISFHPLGIITEADRSFRIECHSQNNLDLMLTQGFEVSVLPTEENRVLTLSPTSCTYTVRAGSINGPIVQFANVGDTVFHIWECNNDQYAMFVHSCFAGSRNESEIPLVGQSGCSLDAYIISNLTYSQDLLKAYASSAVFKFMDVSNLSFKCHVELCLKNDTNCTNHTPPDCALIELNGAAKQRKSRDTSQLTSFTSSFEVSSQEMFINDLKEGDDFSTANDGQHSELRSPYSTVSRVRQLDAASNDSLTSWCRSTNLPVIAAFVSFPTIVSFLFAFALSRYLYLQSDRNDSDITAKH